jgi:hypothetical protein
MATDMAEQTPRDRPIGVTILAGFAMVALGAAAIHLFQAIGILPYFIGPVAVRDFSLWYSLMWGLMIWGWLWAIRGLLDLDPAAWMLVLMVSGFSLIFDFFTILYSAGTTDVVFSFFISLAVFAYALLPGTKRAFAVR